MLVGFHIWGGGVYWGGGAYIKGERINGID